MPDLGQYFAHVLQRNQRSSALTPLLWLTAIVGVPSLYLCVQTQGPARYAFFGLAVVLVLADLIAYGYLIGKDPRLVQSETFQLESRKLDIVASKGGPHLDALVVEVTQEPRALKPTTQDPEPHDV